MSKRLSELYFYWELRNYAKIRHYLEIHHVTWKFAISTRGGSRTHTSLRTQDFESSASAIPPLWQFLGFFTLWPQRPKGIWPLSPFPPPALEPSDENPPKVLPWGLSKVQVARKVPRRIRECNQDSPHATSPKRSNRKESLVARSTYTPKQQPKTVLSPGSRDQQDLRIEARCPDTPYSGGRFGHLHPFDCDSLPNPQSVTRIVTHVKGCMPLPGIRINSPAVLR